MRAILSTTIQLDDAGLISVPVQLCNSTDKGADISFKMGDPNGAPVTQQYVDGSGNVVPRDQMTKTYEGTIIPADQIKAIDEATSIKTMKIEQVIEKNSFPFERIEKSYYVQTPKKGGNAKAFRLLVDALNGSVALVKVCIRNRQSLLALYVRDDVMMASTVTFADQLVAPDEQVQAHVNEAVSEAEVNMARQLLDMRRGTGFMDNTADEVMAQRRELVERVAAGGTVSAPAETPTEAPAGNLIDALTKSLESAGVEVAA